ncbi:MAG: TonB-dependent receptor [Pseudomonadota bacterium]
MASAQENVGDNAVSAARYTLDSVTIAGDEDERSKIPGSVHKIDLESLEQWRYSDIHRVLNEVPGVYVRAEDGFGLRPNIGMRGSGSDRSRKIALMEDGILFAPAPYAAPAAYYFPLLARMQAVEVFKGPAAIKYGPNTVGGAINFVSRAIPGLDDEEDLNGAVDFSIGSYASNKIHAYYGENDERFGWIIEAVHLESEGFKDLDGGGDTGFDKNDAVFKLRFNSDPFADEYHQFDVKFGIAAEVADETYLGLTDDDFDDDPLRRYAASQNDRFDSDHQQFSLSHFYDPGTDVVYSTTFYRREFSRLWDKLNNFGAGAPDLQTILSDPDNPANAPFYNILTGQADSANATQILFLGANDRDFVAQGVQTQADWEALIGDYFHSLSVSLRYHRDEVERDHVEEGFLMQSGELVADGNGTSATLRNRTTADALALFVHDQVTIDDWTLAGGLRYETIDTGFRNKLTDARIDRSDDVLIPGVGATFQLTPNWRLLAGVHKGYVPVAPGSDDEVDPEESINYEFGGRYSSGVMSAEVIGFFNDYSNLAGQCTFSSGCADDLLDLGFNAGEVDIYGLEASVKRTFASGIQGRQRIILGLSYTFTSSEFQNNFTSPQPDLQDVRAGYELPYLPEHQFAVQLGIAEFDWRAVASFKYVSPMRTIAGEGSPADDEETDAQFVVDVSADYQIDNRSQVYATIDNLFDEQVIVARRPFGARPGKPQTLMVGYKLDF